jgi:Alpha/beta hydrolase domain
VAIPDNVRMFYAPGTSHGPQSLANNALAQPDYSVDRAVAATAVSASPGALVASTAMYRALLTNLEGWVKGTAAPLASNFPKVSDGTMAVPTTALSSLGAPDLSAIGLAYNGVYNDLSVNDESVIPSVASATQFYVVHLPKVDGQSNDKGGVKMPDFAVPLATFKGYSLRRSGFVAGDQNGLGSSQLAFALRTASKNAGDPRKSVEELYGTKAGYIASVNTAVEALVTSGLILAADADLYKNRAVMQSLQANFATLP